MSSLRLSPRLVVLVVFGYIAVIGVVDLVRSVQQRTPTPIRLEGFRLSGLPQYVAFDGAASLDQARGVVEKTTSHGNTSVSSDLVYVPVSEVARGPARILVELDRKEGDLFLAAVERSAHFEGVVRMLESDPAKVLNLTAPMPVVRWRSKPHEPLSSLYVALFGLGVIAVLLASAWVERRWATDHALTPQDSGMPMKDGGFANFHSLVVLGVTVYWMYEFLLWRHDSVGHVWFALVITSGFCALLLTRGAALGYGTQELRIARSHTDVVLAIPWAQIADLEVKSSFISRAHLKVVITLASGETLRVLAFGRAAEIAAAAVQAQLWPRTAQVGARVVVQ